MLSMIQSSMSGNKMDSEESKNSPLPSSAGCSSSAPSSAASLETVGDSESHHHHISHPPIVPLPPPHHTIIPPPPYPPHHSLIPRSCPENWGSASQARSARLPTSPPSPLLHHPPNPDHSHHPYSSPIPPHTTTPSPASFVPITQGSEPTVLPEPLHSSEHVETLT